MEGVDGVFDGVVFLLDALEGVFDGALDDALDGALEGDFEGAFEGVLDGALDGVFDAALEGVFEGAFDAAFDGALDRVLAGVFEGAAAFLGAGVFLVPVAFGVLVAAAHSSQSSLLVTSVACETYQSYSSLLSSAPVHRRSLLHLRQVSSMGSSQPGNLGCH